MKDDDKGKPKDSGTIAVTAYYQTKSADQAFTPSATLEEVLDWAVKVTDFAIDPAMVEEFELARHGIKEELPLGDHLGKLAAGAKDVALDLVRSEMPNG